MRHGYTNATRRLGSVVTKSYAGPAADARAAIERRALGSLSGRLPLPALRADAGGTLTMEFVAGRHGQDLLAEGAAGAVLAGCGQLLRQLQSIPPDTVFDGATAGVIVHGDFGPNNVLFDPDRVQVVALLDWEFCHLGEPIEDAAWCEWIVRAHHRAVVDQLPRFFDAYGWTPSWADRRAAMLQRCQALESFCREWDPDGPGVSTWIRRATEVRTWSVPSGR